METDYIFTIIIIGDSNVGKTSLLYRLVNNKFNPHNDELTIGVEYGSKQMKLNKNTSVKLKIWDTAGQDTFDTIITTYFKNVAGAIICYDITNRKSFVNVDTWIEKVKNYCPYTVSTMLVGTKLDKAFDNRTVSITEGKELARKHSMLFTEVTCQSSPSYQSHLNLHNFDSNNFDSDDLVSNCFNKLSYKIYNKYINADKQTQLNFNGVRKQYFQKKLKFDDDKTIKCCNIL